MVLHHPMTSTSQNKRELRRATPVRGTSRGVDDPSVHRDQGFAGGRPREHRNEMKTCMCPYHMCVWVWLEVGIYRCLHVSPLACMRSNLEAKVPDPYEGAISPSR